MFNDVNSWKIFELWLDCPVRLEELPYGLIPDEVCPHAVSSLQIGYQMQYLIMCPKQKREPAVSCETRALNILFDAFFFRLIDSLAR